MLNEGLQEQIRHEIQPTVLEFKTSQGKKAEYEELMRRTGVTTMDDLITEGLSVLNRATGQAEIGREVISVPVGTVNKVRALKIDVEVLDSRATRFAFTKSLARR